MMDNINNYISSYIESIIILKKNDTTTPNMANLGIFDTFKTRKDTLTGTALRQREILGALAGLGSPETRTRTGISQSIAKEGDTRWKNVYSGIFHDIDSVLIPLGLVEEAGRIPPKRGPKALQEAGIPYYHLTREGQLVEIATGNKDGLGKRIAALFSDSGSEEAKLGRALALLARFAPTLASSILAEYVKTYCDGQVKRLLPLTLEKLKATSAKSIQEHTEFLAGALELKEADRDRVITLLDSVSYNKH